MKKRRIIAWALATSMILSSFSVNTIAQDVDADGIEVADSLATDSAVDVDDNTTAGSNDDAASDTVVKPSAEVGVWTSGNTFSEAKNSSYEISGDGTSAKLAIKDAGTGKFSNGEDTMGYYVQPIEADADFTISAKVTIDSFNTLGSSNPNQASLGMMIMNDLFTKKDAAGENDTGRVTSYGVYNALFVPSKTATEGNFTAFSRFDSLTAKTAGDSISDAVAATGQNLGTYDLKISKSGSSYKVSCGDKSYSFVDEAGNMKGDENGLIYPGFFVARDASISVSDIKVTKEGAVELGDYKLGNTLGESNNDKYTITGNGSNASLAVTSAGTGKFSSGEDTIGYYVQQVPVDADFTVSGKVTIDKFNTLGSSNPNQASLGMMIMNDLFTKKTADGANDTGRVSSYGVYNALFLPSKTATEGNFTAFARLEKNIASKQTGDTLSEAIPATGENLGTYELKITKSGSNYKVSYGDKSYAFSDSLGLMTGDENGMIYAGVFVARDAAITVSDLKVEVETKKAVGIELTSLPTQTEYYIGQKLNLDGLKAAVKYDNGTTEEVSLDDLAITGFDSDTVGTKTIKVSKGKVSGSFDVTVRKMKVTNITLKTAPAVNVYNKGALFSNSGASVVATYEDGTTATLKASEVAYTINGKTIDTTTVLSDNYTGEQTVKVSQAETDTIDASGASASFKITIKDIAIESIFVAINPAKTTYYVGDEFNPAGLIVRAEYADGTKANIAESEYTVTGFDSSKVSDGELMLTVTYNSNPELTAQFPIKVFAVEATGIDLKAYPRTTYTVGEAFDKTGLEVVIKYNNGSTTAAVEDVDYKIDLSSFEKENGTVGETTVTFVPENKKFASVTIPVTIREAENYIWRGAIFGQSSGGAGNDDATVGLTGGKSEVIPSNNGTTDGTILVKSWQGSGKITGDHDGIAYYYTRVSNDDNFSLTADVYVRGYMGSNSGPYNVDKKRDGQEGFGIMARDAVPFKSATDGKRTINPAEAETDEFGPVPLNTGAVFASNMAIAGGYSGSSWPADPTANSYEKNTKLNRINIVARTGVDDYTNGGGTKIGPKAISEACPVAGIHTEEGNPTSNLTGVASDETQKGDKYRITLRRVNVEKDEAAGTVVRGLEATCYNYQTGETETDFLDDSTVDKMFATQDKDNVYVGFFAARWGIIEVSNVEFYTSNPMTDEVINTSKEESVIPSITVSSSLYTRETNYSLTIKANNDNGGYVTIKLNDQIVYQDHEITNKKTNIPLTLVPDSTNVVTIVYTPSKADDLTSYADVVKTVSIVHKSEVGDETGDVKELYVSPTGSASGLGTREDPLDLNTALGFFKDGQTIVMLDGVYENPETITINESESGLLGTRSIVADEGAKPVIDFMGTGGGMNIAANNWYIKGIGFKGCGANQHAMNLGGDYCTIEDCTFFDNLATGFQISRVSSDQEYIGEWPSYNLIKNCEAYNNADPARIGADGFAAKLTVGYGNMFKGCISHHNADDGWDCYTKIGSGAIGPVVLEDCISYKQGYELVDGKDVDYKNGGHNGFKMGGENVAVQHYLKDCKTFMNDPSQGSGSGLSANSNPAMKVRNLVAYANTYGGINLYSDVQERYNYDLKGIVSYKNGNTDKIGTYLNRDINEESPVYQALASDNSNYFQRTGAESTNIDGDVITDDFFLSTDANTVLGADGRFAKNADGSFITGDFLERKVAYVHEESDKVVEPGVGGNRHNAWGDPNVVTTTTTEATTEATTKNNENTTEATTKRTSGGGGSSSNNASTGSSSSNGTGSITARPSTDKDTTNDSKDNTTTTKPSGSSAVTVNGIKLNVPEVDPNANINFTDTKTRAWASDAIEKLAAAGIINGVNASKFAPDAYSKRADFIVMLVRTLGLEGTASSNFSDVPANKYYANAVGLAKEAGITTGVGNNKFEPEATITRQDMMVLVAKTLELLGVDADKDVTVLAKFSDSDKIANYAKPYIAMLVNAGIVSGTGNMIDATSDITRAQTAVMMSNVYDIVAELAEAANEEEEVVEEVSEEDTEEASEATSEDASEEVTEEVSEETTEAVTE